ncbi:DegT/DnrJ/EryC1/StrS family aminotransferase [Vreelandella titanicae]|uniref:DegT/DnrJ/EryC1/StrS family aminotransferase n=1 Tax=Vreelandella titanicae TaxID=664683 RepID=UPI0039BFC0F3
MYFTTMNLPAPPYSEFYKKHSMYKSKPFNAIHYFEEKLKLFFEVEAATTFTNCFTGIAIGLLYATEKKQKGIALAALAYRRTTDIVLWAGLEPIYIDNDLETLCMCPYDLEKQLKKGSIGCVLIQHPMVNIIDPNIYISLCEKYNVNIVFDSVEATGGKYNGTRIGNFGLFEAFSLHPSKVINAAEGGVLTFGDEKNYHDFNKFIQKIGINNNDKKMFGIEPIHAELGLASIENYAKSTEDFKEQYCAYIENLQNSRLYELIKYQDKQDPNYKSILVRINTKNTFFRIKLLEFLETFNIGARPYYSPLHPKVDAKSYPNASLLSEKFIILPIGYSVTIKDVNFICKKLYEFQKEFFGRELD